MPEISVIVPVYNVEEYLPRCIDSILAQSFSDFELILVDDGSTDNSGRICDEYKIADNRVIVIHKENEGPGPARNTGIEYALNKSDSEWISFVDSDDCVHKQYLEKLYKGIVYTNCKISVCRYSTIISHIYKELQNDKETEIDRINTEKFFCKYIELKGSSISKMFHYSLFSNVRFPACSYAEDTATIYKILFQCEEIAYIGLSLYYYRQNEQSLMHADWTPNRMTILFALKEQLEFFRLNNYHLAYRKSLVSYAHALCECMRNAYSFNYKKEYKNMKHKLRKHIHNSKKTQSVFLK